MKTNLPLLLALTIALTSCAENYATGTQTLSLVSQDQERAMGQQTAEAHLKQYGLYKPSSKVTNYVQNLCQRMFSVTEIANQPLSCILLDSDQMNAWATPGYINTYRGMLPFLQSEAELASVLGHEAGHITARHIARGHTGHMIAGLAVTALALVVADQTGSDASTQAALQVGGLAAGVATAKYGRDYEREADDLARRYLPRAGYDPRETVNLERSSLAHQAYINQFVQGLRGDDADQEDWYSKLTSSHPSTPERLATAIQQVGKPDGTVRLPAGIQPATPKNDPQGRNRYLDAISGIDFGPQKESGIAGRTYIALPKARLIVRIPEGFVTTFVEMSKEDLEIGQWWGRHPQSDARFRMGWVKYKAGLNVGSLLEEQGITNTQRFQLADGTTAYTGTKTEMMGRTTYRAIAIASPYTDRAVMMVVNFPDAATQAREESAILQTLAQSRLISEDKAKLLKPLQVRIQTVAAGDTPQKLAANLPVGALREELFNAMNGLSPDTKLRPGERVKSLADLNDI